MVVGDYQLYRYAPSLAAAIAATVCFGLITTCHLIHYIAQRTWFFTPFVIGGMFETIGYIGRIINSQQTPNWTTGPYIMQELLLLVAPSLFAASIYMILGRIILVTKGDSRSLIPGRWITRIFVVGDIIAFLAQAGGGGILSQATTSSQERLGNWVIIGGLLVQIIFFVLFILVSGLFHVRMRNHPTRQARKTRVPWNRFLGVLYITNGLILARSVFRVIEFAQETDGALQRREVWLYVFDGLLMFLVMVILLLYHPSRLIREGGRRKGGPKGGREKKGRRRKSSSRRRAEREMIGIV
ncbi:RTA1-domain-containing protein [Aspergillus sclerotiicarbonarius CBS 121057]|uniref:RTA1-domain-containing protein n=1 Tax=Aspergillus sclerotiicarbonarius (strain CBS 121057 / IBT 28362) TaxID=1448318 RepID=A0A319ED09_ASPSB|nr:RTA1-domain-containing protein [Aspergillus sclerotiicarbonarius CBS 121057]